MHRPSHRNRTAAIAALAVAAAGFIVPLAPAAHATDATYCVKLQKIMDAGGDVNLAAGDATALKRMASSLRSSNPPSEYKQAVNDFAGGLDDLAGKVKNIKSKADAKNLAKDFGPNSKYQKGLRGIVKLELSCASAVVPTVASIARQAAAGAIPDSAAINTLAKNIPGNAKAIPVVAACSILSLLALEMDLQKGVQKGVQKGDEKGVDTAAKAQLVKLTDAVRPVDAGTAGALAKVSPKVAATWCKQKGFAN